ncbi:DUF3842 family protein [Bengtsoniella intestinalis]|uniref:DUF3842 family protein n=1 Tax=Bengtsoniella intestinalis TaxID=3073143 RepID=UPI00391F1CA8
MNKPLVVVIDGMGGGIGKSIVEGLHDQPIRLVALGTNPTATAHMVCAGAHEGYTGEETIVSYVTQADIIIGAMGILIPNGLLGEFSTSLVTSICQSPAIKILVPMNKCGIKVAFEKKALSYHIDHAILLAKEEIANFNTI